MSFLSMYHNRRLSQPHMGGRNAASVGELHHIGNCTRRHLDRNGRLLQVHLAIKFPPRHSPGHPRRVPFLFPNYFSRVSNIDHHHPSPLDTITLMMLIANKLNDRKIQETLYGLNW